MQHESELVFFQKLLQNYHLPTFIFHPKDETIPEFDQGLRRILFCNFDLKHYWTQLNPPFRANTIYRTIDAYLCRYVFLQLPKTPEDTLFCIGPYICERLSNEQLLEIAEHCKLSPNMFPNLEHYYQSLPILPDESILLALVTTLGETLWGSYNSFSLEYLDFPGSIQAEPLPLQNGSAGSDNALFNMKLLEERYAIENLLIQAVSQGQLHKAEIALASLSLAPFEQRSSDPVRNFKNYCIIMNTLLRKAVEAGSVHPLHIDSLSSAFARRIEQVHSLENGYELQKEMLRKYCLLVNNHSMKGYSLLVRKVLIHIESDLTADLSLHTLAKMLNVNPSYLSTLFKKDTGMTLTEHVSRKRVEHAVFLLNTTNLQVQTIAQYCGISDVNYFTKTFKKLIGKTPKEYRESISPYSN